MQVEQVQPVQVHRSQVSVYLEHAHWVAIITLPPTGVGIATIPIVGGIKDNY